MARSLHSDDFAAFLQASLVPVLVDFYREGCVPCRRMAPLVSKAETTWAGRLATARVNIDENEALVRAYDIQAAPTLVLFRDGRELDRRRGIISRDELAALVRSALGPESEEARE